MSKFFHQVLGQTSLVSTIVMIGATVGILIYLTFCLSGFMGSIYCSGDEARVSVTHHRLFWKWVMIIYLIGAVIFLLGVAFPLVLLVVIVYVFSKIRMVFRRS
ncbi:hypothetical protein J2Z48_003060 [Croceifilum oryzae]|uniref:Transmembrane protein n=1 Tax=Croceifilum oryzae TaxID=1553429 RepID=A0AAJ1WTI5_9BACL|nr:hypothetical protein [Croceifilum oryzae]